MSNGVSYPVFRTSNPAAALALARRLLTLGEREYAQVSVDAELCTVTEVLRLRGSLPDAWFRTENDDFWLRDPNERAELRFEFHAPELSEKTGELLPLLPLWVSMLDQPVGSVEDEFTALVGANYGWIRWDQAIWPEVPELGYGGRVEHDGVTLVFNCDAAGTDRQVGTHTVCVDVHRTHDAQRYAAWLAERVGLSVIGPPYP
ncbi:hypothetical protein [Streptomyces sp. KS 21]|uniref:hypothetical protein n=1 Tax=Streptomyces sp. KS 21 TaxID=2485150 RepID=UPI0010629CDD|nr:hypothetical protein [Streptomyces sp. KS 21]